MRISTAYFTFLAFAPAIASAVDWNEAPITEDGACEYRSAPWHSTWLEKYKVKSFDEAEATAIRRAKEKCKDGMILLISDATSGRPKFTQAAMNVARALCKTQDIERTQRKAFDDYVYNDFRCPITKIGTASHGGDGAPAKVSIERTPPQ